MAANDQRATSELRDQRSIARNIRCLSDDRNGIVRTAPTVTDIPTALEQIALHTERLGALLRNNMGDFADALADSSIDGRLCDTFCVFIIAQEKLSEIDSLVSSAVEVALAERRGAEA